MYPTFRVTSYGQVTAGPSKGLLLKLHRRGAECLPRCSFEPVWWAVDFGASRADASSVGTMNHEVTVGPMAQPWQSAGTE